MTNGLIVYFLQGAAQRTGFTGKGGTFRKALRDDVADKATSRRIRAWPGALAGLGLTRYAWNHSVSLICLLGTGFH